MFTKEGQEVYNLIKKIERKKRKMKIEIYTDGSCSLNNVDNSERECDGGFGYVVLVDGAPVYEYFDMYHSTTNNRMELRAIIHSLQYCLDTYGGSHEYIVYTDSALHIKLH